jgi:ScaI restriction endonuclease
MTSPYSGTSSVQWPTITNELLAKFPIPMPELAAIVQEAWNSIFTSSIGRHGFKIGTDIFPKPQIMGALLHELIPLEVAARYPAEWRGEKTAKDKDLVFIPNEDFSVEIKTSSHRDQIFGNRSFAQESTIGKKSKSGFYLTVNFGKFANNVLPEISLIRFGWLDHADWMGQAAQTGQQARLPAEVYTGKFKTLYIKP